MPSTTPLPFTLLVNSTDNYADCWEPFFVLMKAYWPDYKGAIVLNSETKTISIDGLDIRPTLSAKAAKGRLPTWTESLLFALDQVETDIVLYVQEDYFLRGAVDHAFLVEMAGLIKKHKITYLGLMDEGNAGPFGDCDFDTRLWKVTQYDPYRISLQACLFSKSRFKRYFRKHENPWHFEHYGNIRAHRRKDEFYTLNRNLYSRRRKEVFPYDLTGIVSRQWKRDVVEKLFAEHQIKVDFSIRGFVGESAPISRYTRSGFTIRKLISTLKSLI
jgi:hypothetical protein